MTDSNQPLGAWLESRLVPVEPEFARAIRAGLPTGAGDVPMASAVRTLSTAATSSLRELLVEGCEVRASAMKLLVVDALATYACEASAYSTGDLATHAGAMMRELATALPESDDAA